MDKKVMLISASAIFASSIALGTHVAYANTSTQTALLPTHNPTTLLISDSCSTCCAGTCGACGSCGSCEANTQNEGCCGSGCCGGCCGGS